MADFSSLLALFIYIPHKLFIHFVYLILCAPVFTHTHFRCNHTCFAFAFAFFYLLTHSHPLSLSRFFLSLPVKSMWIGCFSWHWQTDTLDMCSFISIMVCGDVWYIELWHVFLLYTSETNASRRGACNTM